MDTINELPFNKLTDFELDNVLRRTSQLTLDRLEQFYLLELPIDSVTEEKFEIGAKYFDEDKFNTSVHGLPNKEDYLKVFHTNIRSLNKNGLNLLVYLSSLNVEFDIIVLSEIWKSHMNFEQYIKGYNFIQCEPVSSNIGGVGIFIKEELQYKDRNDLKLQTEGNVIEDVWIEIIKNDKSVIVGGVYRHPNGNVKMFQEAVEKTTYKIINEKRECIITGDITLTYWLTIKEVM